VISSRRPFGSLAPALALSALAFAFVATTAHAEPAADADAIIERGIQLREKGHDDQALVEFRRAYTIFPSPRARAQMALAEQAVGSWVLAEQHLTEALAADIDPWIAARKAVLKTAAAAIARHLGTVMVTGPAQPGARVLIDGVDVGPLPLERGVRLEIGSRLLEVKAPGFYPVVRTLEIDPGGTARETVTLVPSPGGSVGATAAADTSAPERLTEGGAPGPHLFHGAFYPGGPAAEWTLRDDKDAVLCKLPCGYWIDGARKYSLVRAPTLQSDSELRLTPVAFTEGLYAREQIRGPTGSRIAGIVLLAGGAALATVGVVLYATAPSPTPANPTGSFYLDYFGVIGMVAGGFAVAGGIATIVISDPWRVDAQLTAKPVGSLRLTGRGLELRVEGTTAWLTPGGVVGSF
jgi:hypothetical protein